MLITPAIDHPDGIENQICFENHKDLVYYDPNKPDELSEIVKYYLNNDEARENIAKSGYLKTVNHFSLESQLNNLIKELENTFQLQ